MTRFGKFPETSVRRLAAEAAEAALRDAGLVASDIGFVAFANAVGGLLQGQEMIRGQAALRHTGLSGTPMVNVENACASSSTAFHLACTAVASGAVEVAMAVGAEKLTHPDKAVTFAAIGTATDLEQSAGPGSGHHDAGDGAKKSVFMDIYADKTKAYMARSGATAEHFALVASKNHDHAGANDRAQYRDPVSIEDVLASREVSWPLTLLMCAPIGDGAAAVVVMSKERARRAGSDAVAVRGAVLVSGHDRQPGDATAAERAASAAYEHAGVAPTDIDVVELHDAAAPAELIAYEELGLCGPGDGPALLTSAATRLGGRVPVNPSGGLLSRGHPIGATGCAQLVELVDQLRDRGGLRQVEGARLALAQNGGGNLGSDSAAQVVTILERWAP